MFSNAVVHRNKFAPIICEMGIQAQKLIQRSLDLGLIFEAKQLQRIDVQLFHLLHKAAFDFVATVARGRTLLVGEGNLSFALSLANTSTIIPNRIIATTFENANELSEAAMQNAERLRLLGAAVLHGVDASHLSHSLGSWLFDTIIFQFPHTGSREPIEGHNPNFILIRDFLLSASSQLHRDGFILISAVDTPHYRGAFQFEEAAAESGFKSPESYPFDPGAFPEYEHTMSHQNGGALDHHNNFSTWIFRT